MPIVLIESRDGSFTGSQAAQMDLFSGGQYRDFHGEDPPSGWKEVIPYDIWRPAGAGKLTQVGGIVEEGNN